MAAVVGVARREASDAEISSSDEWSFSTDFRRRAFKGGDGASSSSSCARVDCKPNVVLPMFTVLVSLSFIHFLATLRRRFCD